jgi:hypothetical protein
MTTAGMHPTRWPRLWPALRHTRSAARCWVHGHPILTLLALRAKPHLSALQACFSRGEPASSFSAKKPCRACVLTQCLGREPGCPTVAAKTPITCSMLIKMRSFFAISASPFFIRHPLTVFPRQKKLHGMPPGACFAKKTQIFQAVCCDKRAVSFVHHASGFLPVRQAGCMVSVAHVY